MNYNSVPNIITGKDLDYLSDMFNWNYGAYKSNYNAIEQVKDEEIKLLAETITKAPENVEDIPQKLIKTAVNNTQSNSQAENKKPSTENEKKKKGIFLRIDSENSVLVEKTKNLISIFEGDTPVFIYRNDLKKYDFLGVEYLTSINGPMINELKRMYGEDNVAVRY